MALIALVVRDHDEALEFYLDRLGYELVEDTALGADKRWVAIATPRVAKALQSGSAKPWDHAAEVRRHRSVYDASNSKVAPFARAVLGGKLPPCPLDPSSKSVAVELGIHEHTVGKWRRRFLKDTRIPQREAAVGFNAGPGRSHVRSMVGRITRIALTTLA
jgi:catechol 2,3-dioxygenase-like lactoylglutathione lyase family enzyme